MMLVDGVRSKFLSHHQTISALASFLCEYIFNSQLFQLNLYEANGSRNSTRLLFFTLLSRVVARRGLREDFSLPGLVWLEDREAETETKEPFIYFIYSPEGEISWG